MMLDLGIIDHTGPIQKRRGSQEFYYEGPKNIYRKMIIHANNSVNVYLDKLQFRSREEAYHFVADSLCKSVKKLQDCETLRVFPDEDVEKGIMFINVPKHVMTIDMTHFYVSSVGGKEGLFMPGKARHVSFTFESSDKPVTIIGIHTNCPEYSIDYIDIESLCQTNRPIVIKSKSPFNGLGTTFEVEDFKKAYVTHWSSLDDYGYGLGSRSRDVSCHPTHVFLPRSTKCLRNISLDCCKILFIVVDSGECSLLAANVARNALIWGAKVYAGSRFIKTAKEITQDNIDDLIKMSLKEKATSLIK
jgi:hypothetical protein